MKTYIKFHIILPVIILIPAMLWAQDPRTAFKNQMNTLFEYMDKSKITTGLLSDYAFEPVEIAPFNGVPSILRNKNNLLPDYLFRRDFLYQPIPVQSSS